MAGGETPGKSKSPGVSAGGAKPGTAATSAATKSALAGVAQARAALLRLVEVIEHDGRFPVDAYRFLQEGLEFTVCRIHGPPTKARQPKSRHVDGAQLCLGLRDLAMSRWGRMAKVVLNNWGLHGTRDFGAMVFLLVDNEFLQKTSGDRLEDFEEVFPFSDLEQLYEVPRTPLQIDDLASAAGGIA